MAGRAGRRGLDKVGTVIITCWSEPPPLINLKVCSSARPSNKGLNSWLLLVVVAPELGLFESRWPLLLQVACIFWWFVCPAWCRNDGGYVDGKLDSVLAGAEGLNPICYAYGVGGIPSERPSRVTAPFYRRSDSLDFGAPWGRLSGAERRGHRNVCCGGPLSAARQPRVFGSVPMSITVVHACRQ